MIGVQQKRANDAAALPDAGHLAQVDLPVPLARASRNQAHALGIGADFAGVKGIADGSDEFGAVSGVAGRSASILRAGDEPLILHAGERAGIERGRDGGNGNSKIERNLRRPLPSSLLAGLVEDDIDQRLVGFRIDRGQNLRADFDEIGSQADRDSTRRRPRQSPRQ